MAPNHADGLRRVPGCELRWACDLDGERAAGFGRTWDIPRVTTSHAEVLADPELTSVSIAVDHAQHAELALAALRAGKHVLLEKPLALSRRDADVLVAAAEEHGRLLTVIAQHRFDPLVCAIKEWLDEGLLGRVLCCSVVLECGREPEYYLDSYWRGSWTTEGGSVLINQGYHCVDLLEWLLGPLHVVGAAADTLVLADVMDTEDTIAATLRGAGGALVSLLVTAGGPSFWRSRFELVATLGRLTFDIDHPDTLHEVAGDEAFLEAVARFRRDFRDEPPPPGLTYYGVSHRRQIAQFCAAVRSGEPLAFDGAVAAETLRVIADVYAKSGRAFWEADVSDPAQTSLRQA